MNNETILEIKNLKKVFTEGLATPLEVLKDINLTVKKGEYSLCIPNTCRYFTVGVKRDLSRTGKYTLIFNNLNNKKHFPQWLSVCLKNHSNIIFQIQQSLTPITGRNPKIRLNFATIQT